MRWAAYGVAGLFVLIGLASLGAGDGAGGLAMVVMGVGGVLALNQWGNQVMEDRGRYSVFEFEIPVTAQIEIRATTKRKANRILREAMQDGEMPKCMTIAGVELPEEPPKKEEPKTDE